MEDTVKIKLFTWNGKDYIIDVNPEQYKKLIESGKYTEEDLNREFVKNLHRVRDKEGNYYRIIPMEYQFLKKYQLPLPRKHWLARLKDKIEILIITK